MTVFFLDDPLRDTYLPAKDLFYELIEAALASEKVDCLFPCRPWRHNKTHGIGQALKHALSKYKNKKKHDWTHYFHQLPQASVKTALSSFEHHDWIVGYEMPNGLFAALNELGIRCLNIRISPYRFGRDLYVALASTNPSLTLKLSALMMNREEVQLEADRLGASARYKRRYLSLNLSMNNTVIYVGQTEFDASRVNRSGAFASAEDYAGEIRSFCGDQRVLYKAHPYACDFAERERDSLERILNRNIRCCPAGMYEIMAADDDLSLIGISSGALQEAQFFRKKSRSLLPPLCPVAFSVNALEDGCYAQVKSGGFMSPDFWAYLLADTDSRPPLRSAFPENDSYLRSLHDAWWGYSEHYAKSQLYKNAFDLYFSPRCQGKSIPQTQ